MSAQLHSPRMAIGRQLALPLIVLTSTVALAACGGSDQPKSANIDPATANDFTAKLAKIQSYVQAGDCESATQAVGVLESAADEVSSDTGAKFTADFKDLLSQLSGQIDSDCQPALTTTSSSITSSTETSESTTTETSTTDPETTTTTTTTDEVPPAGGPGNGPPLTPPGPSGGEDPGSGGIGPGFSPGRGTEKKAKGEKEPKHGKPGKKPKDARR